MSESEQEVYLSDNAIIEQCELFLTTHYQDSIHALISKQDKSLVVRHIDLPPDLLSFFFDNSDVEFHLKLLTQAVQNQYRNSHPDPTTEQELPQVEAKLSVDDKKLLTSMREINISHRNKLVIFDSTIVSKSEKKSTFSQKVFKCSSCGELYQRKQNRCNNEDCGAKTVTVSIMDSKLTDCEYIECQERQEDLMSNATIPTSIDVKIYGNLVGKFKPGDNVRVVGIVKIQKTVADAVLNSSESEEFSSDLLFDTVVEAHNIQLLSSQQNSSIIANPANHLSDEDIAQVHKLRKKYSSDDDLMAVLVNSFASHIYGHDRIKEAILLQNVGSVDMVLDEGVRNRGKINIFLVGDPGVTKTRLLQAAARISVNGQMASGKGASGVGLTASVESDGGNRGVKKLRIGAAVLAHGGHLSLDEYSNIHQDDRAYLLDCMESGTFRVNKGGINAVLNADASFLVATNPDSGKYNRFNTLFENVTISDQLFSRFHVTFVMPDVVNRELDEKIALHIMSSYDSSILKRYADKLKPSEVKSKISNDLLVKYLLYAKTNNKEGIQISREAMDIFIAFYHEIRTPEKAADITATPRQLEGMLKLGIARARAMLRSIVTGDDATQTVAALSYAYHSAGMITSTGGMNLTAEYSKPLDKLKPAQALRLVMLNLTRDNTVPVRKETVILELVDKAKMETSKAYELFNKEYDSNKLLQNERREFLLMDKYG